MWECREHFNKSRIIARAATRIRNSYSRSCYVLYTGSTSVCVVGIVYASIAAITVPADKVVNAVRAVISPHKAAALY